MSAAKIRLSVPEMELVLNSNWILTKNSILEKVNELFGEVLLLQQQYLEQHPDLLPAEVLATGAKISKGDNYQGLPYRVLDHPRFFGHEGHFAIRNIFWWGNFFSITLHLSGRYKKLHAQAIMKHYEQLAAAGFYFCLENDPWQHHFEKENYVAIRSMRREDFERETAQRFFIKVAKKIPLQEWDNAALQLQDAFILLTGIVKS